MTTQPRSSRQSFRSLALALCAALAACGPEGLPGEQGQDGDALAGSVTATYQRGVSPSASYAGVTDAMLQESTPTVNRGSYPFIQLDRDYEVGSGKAVDGLLQFELTGIPAGARVQSVSLTLNVTNATSGEGYFIYPARKAWSETGTTWNSAAAGSAWAAGGARGSTDRGGTSFGTLKPATTGAYTVALNAAGVTEVQGWVNDPSSNHGFVLDANTNTDGLVFDSSEATTASHRPKLTVTYTLAPPPGNGTGLLGQYFSGTGLSTLLLTRTDATVGFNWGSGSPGAPVPVDHFSARWTGQVQPLYTETYTFYTQSDDGVRLWVNGQKLIDNWTDHAAVENSGSIRLTAGQKYDVKLEYYENGGQAVAKLSWSSASQGKEIIPASQLYPASLSPLAALDESGETIPDTDYAIPSGAVFLATGGSDGNPGTEAAPVATLNKAISLAPSGGTIVVRGGVYRDWYKKADGSTYAIVGKPLTFQAYPHEQAWFDGTDVIPTSQWTSDGAGHWKLPWSTPSFCNARYYEAKFNAQPTSNAGPCGHYDNVNADYVDADNPAAGDPQMVFVDGVQQHEVIQRSDATPGNFYYDWESRVMYLGTNPSGHTVEVASRPLALVLGGNQTYAVKGLGFRRYATAEYEGIQSAALYFGANHSLVENCVFREMAAGALSMDTVGGVLRRSVLADNGYSAAGGNGHTKQGQVDGMLVEHNIFNNNNTQHFGSHCTISCGVAAMKDGHLNGYTIRANLFENTWGGSGYWCDTDCKNGVIVNNVVRNNAIGIFFEYSDGVIVASNLVYDNDGSPGQGLRILGGHAKVYNNTFVGQAMSIWVYDDSRKPDAYGAVDTQDVDVENNILSHASSRDFLASGYDTFPSTYFSGLDYNAYYRSSGCDKVVFDWNDPTRVYYKSLAALTADRGWESHAVDVCTGADPFFVDEAGRNYHVRPSSAAYRSAGPLPADVAEALGVEAGTVFDRGAISWPQVSGLAP